MAQSVPAGKGRAELATPNDRSPTRPPVGAVADESGTEDGNRDTPPSSLGNDRSSREASPHRPRPSGTLPSHSGSEGAVLESAPEGPVEENGNAAETGGSDCGPAEEKAGGSVGRGSRGEGGKAQRGGRLAYGSCAKGGVGGAGASALSGRAVQEEVPIVYFHGLGLGLVTHVAALVQLRKEFPGTTIIVPQLACISCQLCTRVLSPDEMADIAVTELRRLGFRKCVAVGQSYGTLALTSMLKRHRDLIHNVVLFDPAAMALCTCDALDVLAYRARETPNVS